MAISFELDPVVQDLAVALGVCTLQGSGATLNAAFFSDPWGQVRGIFAREPQRAALVSALGRLLATGEPLLRPQASAGWRDAYPLLQADAPGQIYLVVTREGAASAAAMHLSVLAEVAVAGGGPSAELEIALVAADANGIRPVAASRAHPMRVEAGVPVSADGARLVASLLLVADPLDASRLRVRLSGLAEPTAELEVDVLAATPPLAQLVSLLLHLLLAQIDAQAPPAVRRAAAAVPTLLGLVPGLPPLPVGELVRDAGAMRRWLAALFTGRTSTGESTLVVWFGAIGQLLGAPALAQPLPAGTPEDPVLLPLLAPAANVPGISLSAAVRREAADGVAWLVVGLRAEFVASGVADAALRADATVLAVPLAGSAPATVLERLDLRLDATASGAPLVPDAAGFGVRALRAGLSLLPQPGSAAPQVVPLLELLGVRIPGAGSPREFARLDLTDADALGDAAEAVLGELLDRALPGAAAVVQAVRTLLGLGRTPGLDTALLASAPTQAIGAYYRALRATPTGWQPVLQALATLLGDSTGPAVAGTGRADDPWTVPLLKFAAPGAAPAGAMALQLALWDSGDAATPVFTLALRAAGRLDAAADMVGRARLDLRLIEAELRADGQGSARWLGGITAGVRLRPPGVQATLDGVSLRADGARFDLHWQPTRPVAVSASLDGLRLLLGEQNIDLGALRLPLPAGGFDPAASDLGLGLDAGELWRALQGLLAQRAVALGGAQAGALLALVGMADLQGPVGAVRLPPLPLPPGGLPALLADPLAAARAWLAALLSADTTHDAALAWLRQIAQLLAGRFDPDVEALPPIPGGGSPQDPWELALGDDSAALAATLWLAPQGPPRAWAAPTLARLAQGELTAADVLAAADALRGHAPWLGPALHGHAPATAAAQLQALDAALAGSDGVLPLGLATPLGDVWTLGTPVLTAHHRLPRHAQAIAQVRARITTLTNGLPAGGWTVLLVAPPLAGADAWDALLQGVPSADQARVSLRVPGVAAELVDLQAIPSAAWLVVDTGDDGTPARAKARVALERVVDALLRVRPGARIVLVGHSYCGLVARAVAARRAQAVAGLITLAAPVGAGEPLALDDATLGPALRLLQALSPSGLDAGTAPALAEACALLADQLQGGAAPGGDAARPPLAAWRRPPGMGPLPATLPALNIAALAADAPLCTALARTLVRDVTAQPLPAAPTHLCWGLRLGLALPAAAPGEVQVDAGLRLALGSVAFTSGQVHTGAGALDFQARLERPGGWLLGGPGAGAAQAASVRWASFGGVLSAGASQLQLRIDLHDASLQRRALALATLDDAVTPGLLDLLVRTLDDGLVAGGALDRLLGLLATLGLLRRRTGTAAAAVLADGLQALRADAMARLRTELPALLDAAGGLFGWERPAGALAGGGPWLRTLAPLPVECLVETAPWRIRLRTTGNGLALGPVARLTLDTSVPLAGGAVRCSAGLVLPGATLSCAGQGLPLQLQLAGMELPVAIAPADPALARTLAEAVPSALVQAALSLLLEQSLQGTARIAPLGRLLRDPGGWLADTLSDAAAALQPNRVQGMLQALAALVGLQTQGGGAVSLPGGLRLSAADAAGRLRLALDSAGSMPLWTSGATPATLELALQLDIDAAHQPMPGGALRLRLPLPAPSPWGLLDLALGADAQGLRLQVGTDSGIAVQLLPTLSGLETLLSGAVTVGTTQLLPMVLDRLTTTLHTTQPRPAALDDALAVAAALGLYEANAAIGSGFAARAQAMGAFAQQVATGQLQTLAPALGAALATLLGRLFGANVAPPTDPRQVGLTLSGVAGGSVSVAADFAQQPVGLRLRLQDVTLGAVRVGADLGLVLAGTQTRLQASVALSAAIDTGAGLVLQPSFAAGLQVGADVRLQLDFLPLPDGTARIALAPQPAPPTPAELLKLAEAWLLPLAGTLLLREAQAVLDTPLWAGSAKTIGDLLVAAGLAARETDGRLRMLTPLPAPLALLRGLLDGLAGAQVPLPGNLALALVTDARQRYGIALRGAPRLGIGDYALTLHMGLPTPMADAMQWQGADGLGLLLLDMSNAAQPAFRPVLRLGGLGARFGKTDATRPLVDAGGFRLGAVGVYMAADLELMGANAPRLAGQTAQDQRVLGAVELSGLGLVIAPGGNQNPVAGSLVKADGAGGDQAPANPPFDLMVGSPAQAGGGIVVRFDGEPALRIAVRKQFGPLYLEEIALLYRQRLPGSGLIGIGLDASVALAGLKVQADGLSLFVPIDRPGELERWELDLSGLAVSYTGSAVTISGGLLKAQLPTTIEYRGALSVEVAGYGLSAIGAYARPTDAAGEYTSLFIFLAVSAPLGGPPYLFITGVAAGVGVNRRLLTPRDPAAVPGFPLVAAMNPGADPDPMAQLQRIGTDIPPQRGAFWLAAGVKFSTFELLKTTALVTVAVDRGFEISLLGLMQLQLPPVEEAAILSVELALAAKYSTVDQVLSIQAGLTRNSWLISRDCQLTGGFAFVAWFDPARPGVLLTIGGYSANFDVPAHYPVVPRVGFHWNVAFDGPGEIVVKGETFFALTHAAAMVGGALQAGYRVGPVRAWFSAGLDVIIWWDPFGYVVDAHIEVGIEIKLEACAFGICVTLPPLRITQGAWLHLEGPPLSGSVLIDVGVARFTVPFGRTVPQVYRSWLEVVSIYLAPPAQGGGATATAGSVGAGGLPAPQQASGPTDGSFARPWHVAPEFALRVESKMPLGAWQLEQRGEQAAPFGPADVLVLPCGPNLGGVRGVLQLSLGRPNATGTEQTALSAALLDTLVARARPGSFPKAVWDGPGHDFNAPPDAAQDMLQALGGVELRSTVVLQPAVAAADLVLSALVDEEAPLALPFPAVVPTAAPRGVARAAAGQGVAAPAVAASAAATARLVAQLRPPPAGLPGPAPVRAVARARAATVPGAGAGAAALPAGAAQLWQLPGDAPHALRLRGAPRRLTALAGSGAVLADVAAAVGSQPLPAGTAAVLVSDAPGDGPAGWELATPLLQAGHATLLAPGACLLLPRPWQAPARPGDTALPRRVAASTVAAALDGITTRFEGAPTSLLLRLDRHQSGASIDQVRVAVRGATLGKRRLIRHGARVELLYALHPHAGEAVSVTVQRGEGWRLAGVLAARRVQARWARRLFDEKHCRLATPPAATAALPAASVALRVTKLRRKR